MHGGASKYCPLSQNHKQCRWMHNLELICVFSLLHTEQHISDISPVYQSRNLQFCQKDHFETLRQVWDERFTKQYGFFRPYARHVIYRYLDCGIVNPAKPGFVSDVETAVMNTFCVFLASAEIPVRLTN